MKDNIDAVTMAAILFAGYSPLSQATDDAFSDMPVVLTNYSLEQAPSKTPVTISSIDRDLIEASGARTIPDALRLIPGMVIGHSVNDFGDKPLLVVAYHGHSDQFSKQMNVLIDGRSIYDPLLGGVNWYNIPISIDDIERIEVTRGPNASTYGSNSFQAVINIITRHASEDRGHFARVNAGNHEIFDAMYRYGGYSDGIDYRVTLATVNDDGQDRAGDNNADDDVNAGQVDYRLDYQVDTKNLLTYQGGYGRTNQQAHASLRDNFKPLRVVMDTNAHQFLRWDSTIDKDESFVVQYFFNYLDEEDDYLTQTINIDDPIVFDPFQLPINASFTSQRHNLELTHYVTPSDNLDLAWGISGQQDRIDSAYYLKDVNKISRTTLRLFGSVVWDISSNHTIDLGALVEKSESVKTDVSPRLAYLYHYNPNHTFRLGVSRAVRTPFIFEQHGSISHTAELSAGGIPVATVTDRVYNPDNMLETEKITSYEFGYYGKFMDDNLKINARIFQDNLEDLIEAPSEPDSTGEDNFGEETAFVFDNLYATRVRGFEAEMDYRVSKTFRLVASGALLDIVATGGPEVGKRREYEESAPDASLSLLAMKDFGRKYSASAAFYFVGDMAWLDANHNNTCAGTSAGTEPPSGCGFRNTRGYRKLDLRIARHFRSGNDRVTAAFALQNLLDEYSDYDSAPSSTAPAVEQNLVAFFEVEIRVR